ncbi:MAG: S9 family peptidase, partial [Caldilineaceae bacterium]|nr:S9 family peptidase [Caldilineaceae bacterium]
MAYEFARYLNIRSAHMPTFTVDSQQVLFLSDITGNFQVWRVGLPDDAEAHWPQQLTFFADKVWEIHGTPAAAHAIAVSDTGGNERQQFYLIDTPATASSADQGHNIRRLTTDEQAIHRFGVWSKDGQRIYYTTNRRNNIDFDLYTMSLTDGVATELWQSNGRRTVVAVAPDESALLSTEEIATTDIRLHLFDLKTERERPLTLCPTAARFSAIRWTKEGLYAITDYSDDRGALCRLNLVEGRIEPLVTVARLEVEETLGGGELDLFTTAGNGSGAAFVYNEGGWSRLYLLDLATGHYQRVTTQPEGVISKLQFNAAGDQLVFDLQHSDRPLDVWLLTLADRQCRQITFSNRAGIAAGTFVQPTLIHYQTFDEHAIPALYYKPQQPPPAEGYPCILYVHGGPAGQLRPEFDVRFQYFLGQGFAILATNVRGSSGYGRQYLMLDDVELRMDSVRDLYHAVQWLHQRDAINNQRIAIYGRSYGGFMVLAALTEYPALFAAGIDVVG